MLYSDICLNLFMHMSVISLHKLPLSVLPVPRNLTESHIAESWGKHKATGKFFNCSQFSPAITCPKTQIIMVFTVIRFGGVTIIYVIEIESSK